MKILHVCTNTPYIDGWGYQENLLPQYLAQEGVESVAISSDLLPKRYLNGKRYPVGSSYVGDVKVIRVKSWRLGNGLTFTKGLYKQLEEEKPDVILHHALNFTTLPICARYAKKSGCQMYVDNHADYINCYQNKFYRILFYQILTGWTAKLFDKPIRYYYGVTHGRCDFLEQEFGVKKEKVKFLPIGCDESMSDALPSKEEIRKKYEIDPDATVIVSGGKMGIDKGTIDLINAVEKVQGSKKVQLILFGRFDDKETENLAKEKPFVKVFGWCDRNTTLELLKLSDLACWPIHHTTLCEDSVACCTPLLLRKTRTTEHLIDGNGFFMETGSESELLSNINTFINMDATAKEKMHEAILAKKKELSYTSIAKMFLNDCIEGIKK